MPLDEPAAVADHSVLFLDGTPLSVDAVVSAALGSSSLELACDAAMDQRLALSESMVQDAVASGEKVYGVTTAFGGMADHSVPQEMATALQNNLLSFLATGAGEFVEDRHIRAAMLLRANVLMQGYSGVRKELIQRLVTFFNAHATPQVRSLGSIGASGDLVPLSTIARAITGQSDFVDVKLDGNVEPGHKVLSRLELSPLELQPKEGLALVNGTSFSSAIAANAIFEAKTQLALTLGAQTLMLRALLAQEEPFNAFVHQCKPHPGQVWVAKAIRELLRCGGGEPPSQNGSTRNVQDRYSLRCLPQYLGPIAEGIVRVQRTIETEMNGVSDNPLINPDASRFYQSGNFLGQYLALGMDELRRWIGLMAKHLDVQIATLVTPEFSGLPPSLQGNAQRPYNMGLKGLQITGNAIMPMLTFYGNGLTEHFPTHAEQYNQNVNGLSFGSSHLAWQSVKLYRDYLSVALLFGIQALDLRAHDLLGHYDGRALLGTVATNIYNAVMAAIDAESDRDRPLVFNDSDRWLEADIQKISLNQSSRSTIVQAIAPILQSLASELSADVFKDA